jgi:hypothetical protein
MPALNELTDELLLKNGLITLQGDWTYKPRRWCAHDFGAFSYHDVPGEPEYIVCIHCGHVEPLNAVAYEPLQAVPDHLELSQYQWLSHRKQGRLKHVENPNKHP